MFSWGDKVKKALAYIRVSQEGENPENQVEAIKEWAKKNEIEILGWYIDVDVSGATKPRDRPQYKAMIEAAKKLNINLILFYDLSRLARSVEHGLEELKNLVEDGIDYRFVAQEFLDYIEDKMLRKKVIMDFLWFAELYREDIRRRTKEALRRIKKEGRRLGRPPFPLPAEEVRRLRKQGWPLTKIHAYLVRTGKICRKVDGKEKCMSYERFRRRVKSIL